MREYSIGIPTNVWNAVRYAIFTLVAVPLAEKFWARLHAKRTGSRLARGNVARLRQSKLAHWGLHQEVYDRSRMSKASAFAVCVLHIAGALLLEYGSSSRESPIWQNVVLSRSLRDDGGLQANRVYFFDAENMPGRWRSSFECIDGGVRNLSDFGIRVKKTPNLSLTSTNDVEKISNRIAEYYLPNSARYFQVYDNGAARSYGWNDDHGYGKPSTSLSAFMNESIVCRAGYQSAMECIKNSGKESQADLLADALADSGMIGVYTMNRLWRHRKKRISTVLNRVSATDGVRVIPVHQVDKDEVTSWLRRGMPRGEIPRLDLVLKFDLKLLHEDCRHRHAIPLSGLSYLKGLTTSNHTFPPNYYTWNGNPELIVWTLGNFAFVGGLAQEGTEYCSTYGDDLLCLTRVDEEMHELAYYYFSRIVDSSEYEKVYNFTVEGALRKADALDLVIQALLEHRNNIHANSIDWVSSRNRVVRLIESGNILSGLVRIAGRGIEGKSSSSKSDIATVNILGICGAVVLVLLVVVPFFASFAYRIGAEADVEMSYRRAVMEIHGTKSCTEVPDTAPSIVGTEVDEGKPLQLFHTYTM